MSANGFPYQTSFWCEQGPQRLPPLEGMREVADVAVVGGGFAGISTARHLKESAPSLDVVLLEAEHVGFGASGRNAGFVSPFPPLTWFADHLSETECRREVCWAVSYIRERARELKALIDSEGIDCDLHEAPLVIVAPDGLRWAGLRWMAERCDAVGLPCRLVAESEMREQMRYPGRGGIAVGGQALQPYRLARGLLEVLRRRGVRVFEGTRISRVLPSAKGVELLTDAGTRLRARKVVLATNAYTPGLRFGPRKLFPMSTHTYMLATEPLREETLERFGFRASCIGDASILMPYLRVYGHRLLFGGGGKMFSRADAAADQDANAYRRLYTAMLGRFPFLAATRVEAAWAGPIHETLTDAPIVKPARDAGDVLLNVGYSSSGVALTQFSGRMLTGFILGKGHEDTEAERLRRMYCGSRMRAGELLKMGVHILRRAIWGQ